MSPAQAKIKEIVHDLFEAKMEAVRSYYFYQNLGVFSGTTDHSLGDDIGYLQFVLNRNALLGVVKIFDRKHRNKDFEQLTIEEVIATLPTDISEYNGMEYAANYLKLKKASPAKIKSRYQAWLKRIRNRPYYKSMLFVRNKILAHSQSIKGATIGPIRGRNMLRLIEDTEWFIKSIESIVFSVAFSDHERPTKAGSKMIELLLPHKG